MFWLVTTWLALAGTASQARDTVVNEQDRAEFQRLTQEIEKLAQRNAWAGVQRNFDQLVAIGLEPSFETWVHGAHAARATGDATASRERLVAANEVREDKEILDWLWQIDSKYGHVFLACDLGKNPAVLSSVALPFDPNQQRAVEFAQAQVTESCLLDGLLPEGSYTFEVGDRTSEIRVVPRVQTVRVDLRGVDTGKRKKEKKKDKGGQADASED